MQKIIRQQTFITAQGMQVGSAEYEHEMKNQRLEEAKTKNTTFQLFDKMLGIEKDPKLLKIREDNPLNNITAPQCDLSDLDDRIG